MKVLVTGGAGFIGSNFIRYWLKKYPKDKIINLDKLTYAGNLENLKDVVSSNYKFVKGDIADKKLVDTLTQSADVIVNFAAETHVDRSIGNPEVFLKTNVLGTKALLDAALKNKVKRFHQISTDEVFGALKLDSKNKFTESSPYNPRSPYAASKASADHLVHAYHHTYGLPITISNCSNNFGPYQFPEKLLPLFITNALEDVSLPLYGDGKYVRDWIFVEDHNLGVETILQNGKVGEVYLIGSDNEMSNINLAKKVLKMMGKEESLITHVKDRPGHDRRYALDAGKIKKELGFKPRHSFEEGLKITVTWYKNNKWWWQPLRKSVDQKGVWTKKSN